jgi:glycosyltransferase involved in cell wall biosynthesis
MQGLLKSATVGLVCEGDASTSEKVFSGSAKRLYETLIGHGHPVVPVDARLRGFRKAAAAAVSFSPHRERWQSRFRYTNQTTRYRSILAEASLGSIPVDILLQVGATYDPPRMGKLPFVLYCDWSMALTALDAKAKGGHERGLTLAEIEQINLEHARRYRAASAIFTLSDRLRSSIIDLYSLDPNRVHTTYAGPNFDHRLIEETLLKPRQNHTPTVLFIAKEFERKGGDTVASAFLRLHETLPQARLVFAGTEAMPPEFRSLNNVEHLGLLDKNNTEHLDQLLTAYRNADVLVLPSRRDPFPTVIREAMFFGLPCVATNIWAMPEMIEDGKTGFLVPVDDTDAIVDRLALLLGDEALRNQMGQAARARAEAKFSWDAVGKLMSTLLDDCLNPA